MLNTVIENHLTPRHQEIIGQGALASLEDTIQEHFIEGVNTILTVPKMYNVNSWYETKKARISKFLRELNEGIESLEGFTQEEKQSVAKYFALQTEHNNSYDIEGAGWRIKQFTDNLKEFKQKGYDTQKIIDMSISMSKGWSGAQVGMFLISPILEEGGVERLEQIYNSVEKVCNHESRFEWEIYNFANDIIDSGVDFEEVISFYINHFGDDQYSSGKYYMKYALSENIGEILKTGGLKLLEDALENIDWMFKSSRQEWPCRWISQVPRFYEEGVLGQKKLLFEDIAKRKTAGNGVWDASVPKRLKSLEDKMIQFSSFNCDAVWGKLQPKDALDKLTDYLMKSNNPEEDFNLMVEFRETNKRRVKGLKPEKVIDLFLLYEKLGQTTDILAQDMKRKECPIALLPKLYTELLKLNSEEQAKITLNYIRENFAMSFYSQRPSLFAQMISIYNEMGRSIEDVGDDLKIFGQTIERFSGIYNRLQESAIAPKGVIVMNHLRKKRQRRLIEIFSTATRRPSFYDLTRKIPDSAGKKDIARIIKAYETNANSARKNGIENRFNNKIKRLRYGKDIDTLVESMSVERLLKKIYTDFVGISKVPEEYREFVDLCISSKNHLKDKEFDLLGRGIRAYLKKGDNAAKEFIKNLEENKKYAEIHPEHVIAIDKIENKKYTIRETQTRSLDDIMDFELVQINDALRHLKMQFDDPFDIDIDKIPQEHRGEIQLHLENIKKAEMKKSKTTEVEIYVGDDLLENLHMGTYFKSCLSIDRFNFRYAVQHCFDANKGVFYMRNQNGRVIGRNRFAVSEDGIILTRFYQHEYHKEEWDDFLQNVANTTSMNVYVPNNTLRGQQARILTKKIENVNFKEGFYADGTSVYEVITPEKV